MAGKWAMVKAFGEAAAKKAKKGKGILESVERAALEHVDFDTNKPFDDVGRAFNEGVNRGNRESWTVRYGSDNGNTTVEHFNTEEEARKFYNDHYGAGGIDFLEEPTLESGVKPRGNQLQNDFDEAFEEAVARRKEDRLNEWDWDGKPENQVSDDDWDYRAAKDRDDTAEQQVRDEMIKELKSGMPLSDFFEKYR